jgi:hypothetical protein
MTCIPEIIREAGSVAILEQPLGLRDTEHEARIAFQRGYWASSLRELGAKRASSGPLRYLGDHRQ